MGFWVIVLFGSQILESKIGT